MYLQMMISDETIAKEHGHGGHVNKPIKALQEESPNDITSHSDGKSEPSFPIECSDDDDLDDGDDYGNTHMERTLLAFHVRWLCTITR